MMACRLCGGDLRPWIEMPLDAKKDEATPFDTVLRCADCETGMLTPQPRPDQIADLYRLPHYYTQGGSHIADAEPRLADRILTKLAWTVDRSDFFDAREVAAKLPPRARVIDLGCGDAALLTQFRAAGCIVLGVDPDPAAREVAADRNIPVLAGTAEDLPEHVDEGQFDLVLMTHSLEHTRDPLVALGNAYRLTRPGGLMYVELPNCGCAHFASLTKCSENFDGPRHLWFFTAKGLRQVVGQVGFEVLHYHFNGFTRHHLRSWRNWEQTIFDRLNRRGLARGARRHSLWRSLMILARSAFAPPARKYDCVGILAAKS